MMYIHFTAADEFKLIEHIDPNAGEPGIFVYRYSPAAVSALTTAWGGRRPVLIDFRGRAKLIQRDPLTNNRARDEYLIPASRFAECRILEVVEETAG